MTPTQISFTIPDKELKNRVAQKLKKKGSTMKFLFLSALEAYDKGEYDFSFVPKKSIWRDDMMTEENEKHYAEAKKDFKNGVNIVSWEELKAKHFPEGL